MNRQQMLEQVEKLSAYEVKDHRFIEEMNSEGMVLGINGFYCADSQCFAYQGTLTK